MFKFFVLLSGFLFAGCSYTKNYVKLAEEVQPKTAMVYVATVVEVLYLSFGPKGFEVHQTTQTVTIRGAGVFISPNGHVLSCNHLFDVGVSSTVTVCNYDGICTEAEVLYKQPHRDLSLLKINVSTPTPYARLADTRELRVGQEVMAVGNPYGLEFTVTKGIVSALNRDFSNPPGYNLLQLDAPINPGNSGGPVFNLHGELVGIVVQGIREADGLGFAVETGQLLEFLTKFRGLPNE